MRIILRIIEILLALLAITTVSTVIFLYRPDWSPFQEPTFGTNVIPVATMTTAWTTLLVAYAAFRTIRSNREKEERDKKLRILNEITEWATEIHTASLKMDLPKIEPSLELYIEEKAEGNQEIIESIKSNIINKEHYRIEVETFLKYSIPCSKAVYIRELASENFKGHGIVKIVDDIIDDLVALMFLRAQKIGIENPKEGFGDSAIAIMNRIEEELKNTVSTNDTLLKKYAKELSVHINALFTGVAKIISDL
jgi:hypothetical protein